jgi:fructose-bisphosphate aldolase class II
MKKKIFPAGVIQGQLVRKLFNHAKKNNFAIPAINVFGPNSINSCLEISSKLNAPIIIQISYGGAIFNSGYHDKQKNNIHNLAIKSSKILANHVHELAKFYNATVILHTDHCNRKLLPWLDGLIVENNSFYKNNNKNIFSSHMIDLSEDPLNINIQDSIKYLKILNNINIFLEIELGMTGGEEDAIDNTNIDIKKLYTTPQEVYQAYKNFIKITNNFSIAASFGNMHGVYKPGTIKLNPEILKESQHLIKQKFNYKNNNPINFVFHGGSGSNIKDLEKSITYGVVKVNFDTDLQYAFTKGVKSYFDKYELFLQHQIGNTNNKHQPNKKYYDPRVWMKKGEQQFKIKLESIFNNLNNINTI